MLAIQETHLDEEKTKKLNTLFERQVHFISSLDPCKPNLKGVAFAIRKKSVKWAEIRHRAVKPGRTLVIEIPWHENSTISIMNVYAPNNPSKNKYF